MKAGGKWQQPKLAPPAQSPSPVFTGSHKCCHCNAATHLGPQKDRLARQCWARRCCKGDVTSCCISHRHHCSATLDTFLSFRPFASLLSPTTATASHPLISVFSYLVCTLFFLSSPCPLFTLLHLHPLLSSPLPPSWQPSPAARATYSCFGC